MTDIKKIEIEKINKIQDRYIAELINTVEANSSLEEINLTSPTGTGKSKMIAKLINSSWGQQHFFIITTLSRGNLNEQIEESLKRDCNEKDFVVYGSSQLTAKTILRPEDVQALLEEKSNGKPIIWIRDEAHIETNSFKLALKNRYKHIINFSATNSISDIECDFSATCMLRTPNIIEDADVGAALDKLLEIKKEHAIVPNYNPCAVFRCINNPVLYAQIISEAKARGLKYVDLNEEGDSLSMLDLCKDDNEYDVIINKMKIVEGVDLRRAHIMYLGNVPENPATIIQFAGRARRNALLWKDDFDIFEEKYSSLYNSTRNCYIYFNVDCKNEEERQKIQDKLTNAFRNVRSVEEFVVGTELDVTDGKLINGITIYQLQHQTGKFVVEYDENLKCKVINPLSDFYTEKEEIIGAVPEHGYKIVRQELWGEKVVGYYDSDEDTVLPWTPRTYNSFKLKINDYESSAISSQYFRYMSDIKEWYPERSISFFLDKTSSNAIAFIDNKYNEELNIALQYIDDHHLSSGHNDFHFNKICNSCLGWLVEFYTKYLVFGRDFLLEEIKSAQSVAKTDKEDEPIIFYACFLKYRSIMIDTFGGNVARFIKGPSISDYIKADYKEFVGTVIKLAQRTYNFLINQQKLSFRKNGLLFNENLAIENIRGKADFLTEDTIVDLKATNNITKRYIRQVLFYHYLSTKRSDLNIKRVIVYDCVSDKYVEIPINQKNWTTYYAPLEQRDDSHLPSATMEQINVDHFLQKNINTIIHKMDHPSHADIFIPTAPLDCLTAPKQKTAEHLLMSIYKKDGLVDIGRIRMMFKHSIKNKLTDVDSLEYFKNTPYLAFPHVYAGASSVIGLMKKHAQQNKGFLIKLEKCELSSEESKEKLKSFDVTSLLNDIYNTCMDICCTYKVQVNNNIYYYKSISSERDREIFNARFNHGIRKYIYEYIRSSMSQILETNVINRIIAGCIDDVLEEITTTTTLSDIINKIINVIKEQQELKKQQEELRQAKLKQQEELRQAKLSRKEKKLKNNNRKKLNELNATRKKEIKNRIFYKRKEIKR